MNHIRHYHDPFCGSVSQFQSVFGLLLLAVLCLPTWLHSQENIALNKPSKASQIQARQACEASIRNYFEGYLAGDHAKLTAAFDTSAGAMFALRDSGKTTMNFPMRELMQRWVDNVKKNPYSESDLKASKYEVLSCDVVDDAMAVVKLDITLGKRRFLDYLALYKIAGAWKIVSKVFVAVPQKPDFKL
jgi:hypothetical protein